MSCPALAERRVCAILRRIRGSKVRVDMDDGKLRELVTDVKEGRLSRRAFVGRMVALGLSAPMAGMMLSHGGAASAAPADDGYKPTKAGGGGALKMLFWQAPTLLNPHFASGGKDQEPSRIFYEPLASWDSGGNLVASLAAELPSRDNGLLAADGRSVTWKLKPGVRWHDGRPLTADDVVFTWRYAGDPASATVTIAAYKDVRVEKVDDLTVRVLFDKPTPFWANAFVAASGMILPEHVFGPYIGAKSREAPANLMPVGTGPYRCTEFRPGDLIHAVRFEGYHQPTKPHFDTLEIKGGGDAVSAARAVLQTGDYDYAWNMAVEDDILKRLEQAGKGRVIVEYGNFIEFILLNATDPNIEVDGQRSSLKTKHPAFSDPAVRQAMRLLIDRKSIGDFIYGRTARPSNNVVAGPAEYASPNTSNVFDVEAANRTLDAAGWARGPDGIRAKDGYRMHFLFQTTVSGPRQKTQAIIKQAAAKAGIEIELKTVPGSVFFAEDPGNTDTSGHFYADMEEYGNSSTTPDPADWMTQYYGPQAAQKENKWSGANRARFQSAEFDALFDAAAVELDPVKRAAMYIRMNDIAVAGYVLPIVQRAETTALANGLHARLSAWDDGVWAIADWYKDA